MKYKFNVIILFYFFTISINCYSQTNEFLVAEPIQQDINHNTFIANNIMVGKVFDAISERLNKPIILSKLAAQKRVTGNFSLANPDEMFKALTRRVALVWYDDGATIYIYDNSEMRSVIIPMNNASSIQVINYIKNNGIYDQRFPVRAQDGNSLLFISGPPLYIELIKATALYLSEQLKQEILTGGELAVIPIQYASVSDRNYILRGQNVTIPGMLSVISALFKNRTETPLAIQVKENKNSEETAIPASKKDDVDAKKLITDSSLNKKSDVVFSLVAHPDSNSLIVKGSSEQINNVRQLVKNLDMRRRQVELSLWIIDITRSELDNLGINWEVGGINTGKGALTFNRSTLVDNHNFLLQIDALSKSGNGNIVSRPVLLTQENIPALFDNNTSFYAKLQGERIATLEQITYGTMISVIPRISSGNSVEMEVNIEDGGEKQQHNGESSNVEGLPSVSRTSINTVARIAKDSSLLIGGYTREQIVQNDSKIPLLGDIPIIGEIFRHSSVNQQKMVRLFLIQPRLLDENEVWDGRQFSENTRIKELNSHLHGTIQFLKNYMESPWQ
ncbi:type III secretion system outer membrane ring subunit SctC [Providencia sneebia]|uniref:Type 3 secretion system secretin n=1 Tax=Providencia sneebia DSM 19967 TaxID=1141660 RepID=K8WJX3_9GAMM|nr:type III secretion system outer membrane ring subunit SctC [Providencia sneebia]EKT60888.1 type III secretion system protein [Providencia sneebia DSM 19967]